MADPYAPNPPSDTPEAARRAPHLISVRAASTDASTGKAPSTDERARVLSENEYTAVAVVAALVAALGLLGFVNSFAAVQAAAQPSFGWLAFTVPLGIDLGIAIFAALDIVLARLRMRIRALRVIPWALTAATIYLNVAPYLTGPGRIDWFAVVAHAMLPALWVVAVEVAAHVVRVRADLTSATATAMDRVRGSRWLLSPWRTAMLRRRMILWEIRSYPDALRRERDRLLALTELQDRYGWVAWRWQAPRRTKALYRLGELTPATDVPALPAAPHGTGAQAGQPATPTPPVRRRAGTSRGTRTATARGRSRRGAAPDVDDLMPLGRQVAADLDANGAPLTRDTLAAALRERGRPAGNARVGALLARLKTESPPTRHDTAPDNPAADAEGGRRA